MREIGKGKTEKKAMLITANTTTNILIKLRKEITLGEPNTEQPITLTFAST